MGAVLPRQDTGWKGFVVNVLTVVESVMLVLRNVKGVRRPEAGKVEHNLRWA